MFVDFLIGFFAVNALPHYLFGRMNVGVLSLFGFGALGNLCYSALCLVISLALFSSKYGLGSLGEHMLFVGGLTVVLVYLVSWDLVNRFLRRDG